MTRSIDNSFGQPSLEDLMVRFLANRSDASTGAVEHVEGEVEPHEVAAGFRVDPRAAWTDASDALARPDSRRQANVAVVFHMRFTRPLVGVLLVLMGLGVILRDQNKNVFVNVGLCLILCVVFYIVFYGCKFLGENDILAPAPAAWLPVLIFGPFAFVLFDAAHT